MKLYHALFLIFVIGTIKAGQFPTGLFSLSDADEYSHEHDDTGQPSLILGDDIKKGLVDFTQFYLKKFVLPSPLSLTQKALTAGALALITDQQAVIKVGPLRLTARQATEKTVSALCMASIIIPRFFKATDKQSFVKETLISLAKEPAITLSYNGTVNQLSSICGSSQPLSLYPEFIENNPYLQIAVRYVWHKHVREGINTILEWTTTRKEPVNTSRIT